MVVLTCGYLELLLLYRLYELVLHSQTYEYFIHPPLFIEIVFLILNLLANTLTVFPVMILSIFQSLCLAENATSIERWEKDKVADMVCRGRAQKVIYPYDLGTYQNICAVLGENPLTWMWPKKTKRDGLVFKVNVPAGIVIVWPPPEYEARKARRYNQSAAYHDYDHGEGLNDSIKDTLLDMRDFPMVRKDSEGYVVTRPKYRKVYSGEREDEEQAEKEGVVLAEGVSDRVRAGYSVEELLENATDEDEPIIKTIARRQARAMRVAQSP